MGFQRIVRVVGGVVLLCACSSSPGTQPLAHGIRCFFDYPAEVRGKIYVGRMGTGSGAAHIIVLDLEERIVRDPAASGELGRLGDVLDEGVYSVSLVSSMMVDYVDRIEIRNLLTGLSRSFDLNGKKNMWVKQPRAISVDKHLFCPVGQKTSSFSSALVQVDINTGNLKEIRLPEGLQGVPRTMYYGSPRVDRMTSQTINFPAFFGDERDGYYAYNVKTSEFSRLSLPRFDRDYKGRFICMDSMRKAPRLLAITETAQPGAYFVDHDPNSYPGKKEVLLKGDYDCFFLSPGGRYYLYRELKATGVKIGPGPPPGTARVYVLDLDTKRSYLIYESSLELAITDMLPLAWLP